MGWVLDDLDELILHQVSKVHTEQLAATLGLSMDKIFRLYPEFGNIGPGIGAHRSLKSARCRARPVRDRIALMGIGSGLELHHGGSGLVIYECANQYCQRALSL